MEINYIHNGDCLEFLSKIDDNSIDMVLCDLPYGTTKSKWDIPLDIRKLWNQYSRVCKDNAAIVLTSLQPFTTKLISSNLDMFKYCWYWEKERLTNIMQVKNRPGKTVEEIVVFYKNQPVYNPQMEQYQGKPRTNKVKNGKLGELTDNGKKSVKEYVDTGFRYPTQVLRFKRDILTSNLHPTQKPLELFEYLIKTYTNTGQLVLDNCIGSGTTAVACINTDRNYIGIEKDLNYFNVANERIEQAKFIKNKQIPPLLC